MSLWYYQGKIPPEYALRMRAKEGRNGGFYVGFEKIAELTTSTEELRRIMQQRDEERRRIREENERQIRIRRLKNNIESIASNTISYMTNIRNNLFKDDGNLIELENNYNSIMSTLGNDPYVQKHKNKLKAKHDQMIGNINQTHRSNIDGANELINKYENLARRANETENEADLNRIYNEITSLPKNIYIAKTNAEIVELNNVIKNASHLKNVEEELNKLNAILKGTRFEKDYLVKANKSLDDVDISNVNTIHQFEKIVDEIKQQVEREQINARALKKSELQELTIHNALAVISEIKRAVQITTLQDYSEEYMRIQTRFDEVLNSFGDVQSLSIADRRNQLVQQVSELSNPNTFMQGDYAKGNLLVNNLANLKSENEHYNYKKEEFDNVYYELKEKANKYDLEIADITFDIDKCDEQIKEINAASNELEKVLKHKQLEITKANTHEMLLNNGFTVLNSEEQIDEISYRRVYISAKNPYVVTVVDITNSNNTVIHSHPVVAKNRGGYIYPKNTQELRESIKSNCADTHNQVKVEDEKVKDDSVNELEYYVLSEEASKEYLSKINYTERVNRGYTSSIVEARELSQVNNKIKIISSVNKRQVLALDAHK